jgi:hypothetical protein
VNKPLPQIPQPLAAMRVYWSMISLQIHSEMEAYIMLMRKLGLLNHPDWIIEMTLIRPLLAKFYD